MARKDLTTFLIALNDSVKLRDRWRDAAGNPEKLKKVLQPWGLEDEPAVKDGGDIDLMRAKVRDEDGLKQVDLWIRSAGAPESNPDYDAGA
jgi:hypothetical protein